MPWYAVQDDLPDWVGVPLPDTCKGVYHHFWCPGGGEIRHLMARCLNRGCLRCTKAWAQRQARRVVTSFQRAREAGGTSDLWHVHLDPPEGAVPADLDAYLAFRKASYVAFKAHGATGGAVVLHHARRRHPGRWSPHVHGVLSVPGRWKPGPYCKVCEAPAEASCLEADHETWVIRFERKLGAGGLPLWVDLHAMAMYELTHASRPEKPDGRAVHALTWWGDLNYAKRSEWDAVEPEEPVDLPLCPDHGCELEPLDAWSGVYYDMRLAHGGRPPPAALPPPRWRGRGGGAPRLKSLVSPLRRR